MDKGRKNIYLEVMRIIACFFVVFTHTKTDGYFLFSQYPVGSFNFWNYMIPSVFAKFSVAIFFAVSGALLLNKQENMKTLYKKRVLKILIILLIWSFINYLLKVFKTNQEFTLKTFFVQLYSKNWNFTYWYLYAYLTFLIVLPLLRRMVNNMTNSEFYLMFGIAFTFTAVIPIIKYFTGTTINSHFDLSVFGNRAFIYPCLGYFLEHKLDINKVKKIIPFMWILNILTIGLTCYLTYLNVLKTGVCSEGKSQGFYWCFVIVNCTTIFITIKYIFSKFSMKNIVEKLIISLGKCTFGIYLLHLIFLESGKMKQVLIFLKTTLNINPLISCYIYCVIIMIICYIITLILKKIPLVKRIV